MLTSLPVRILVSTGLLAIVATTIDWNTLGDSIGAAAWGWYATAIGITLAALVVGALRWAIFVWGAGMEARLGAIGRAYGIGAFSNNFLPTGFGGDLVRALIIAPRGRPLARSITSVAVDRVSALACGLILAWVGVSFAPSEVPGEIVWLLAATTCAGVVATVIGIALLRRRGPGRLLPEFVRPWASEAAQTLRAYGANRSLQARTLGLGLLFQTLMVAATWAVSEAFGLNLSPALLAAVIPLVLIVTVVPISVAGFGVREGAFVALLAQVDVSSADATLLSLGLVTAMAIATLPGGLAIALRGGRAALPR